MAKSDPKPYGLHIPKNGKTWVYDFRVDNERYHRTTRQTRYSEAVKVAGRVHAEATGSVLRTNTKRLPDMPIREAFGRYYNERGSLLKSAPGILSQLNRLALGLGPDLPLSRLTLSDLMEYQVRRRREVANRTVNGEVPELIRPLIKRARKWGIDVGELGKLTNDEWSELKLPTPKHRTRSASRAEAALLLSKLRKDYRPIILFALKSGLRKAGLLVKRNQVDFHNHVLRYAKKSKTTGDIGWLPLTGRMEAILKREIVLGGTSDYVFTFKAKRTIGDFEKGKRYPITSSGLKSEMQRAVEKAGLEDWRLIHDLRHTAATETLRSSQNLAAVQIMLGHSDIAQTSRYAHVLNDDARRAMETRR
jgi:integrase